MRMARPRSLGRLFRRASVAGRAAMAARAVGGTRMAAKE
ncbi:16S rRNA methyltransferase [Burkholderia pseudomallei]|uniref:Uncharacterized protein n=1 Tax=Burkholderia pseudomallei 1710a TaxID=320371 RepID=A0A0E1W691_BURPE|nr:16S rRNA methyltransferase [Burkholderia pseudomallei]EDO84519.1 ribosomal RNA small subunit methyltransferase B [Burkholderia pseudomallei 406e]EDS86702.1 hypothetical protein BURPSS13_P0033 [Burkholderia pseudomallei S13]EET07904.1 hypothetical protein BURPS1710A_1691 [Burkholderia pseudomallei 1710a]PNW96380.1 16S rRNA methyltransferase [Burkholderia pseudomallei]